VSHLYDTFDLNSFAEDICIPKWNKNAQKLSRDMEREIEAITKLLKQAGLKVNNEETDICMFNKCNVDPKTVWVNDVGIVTKESINVRGVLFDNKLKWSPHIENVINKANKSLRTIKLIRKFFNKDELIIVSLFFFYNSEIWHLPTLDKTSKLFASSANAQKCVTITLVN
jgi:hypothetical protein